MKCMRESRGCEISRHLVGERLDINKPAGKVPRLLGTLSPARSTIVLNLI